MLRLSKSKGSDDDHIHTCPLPSPREFFSASAALREAAEHFDARGEGGKSFLERFKMLEGMRTVGRQLRIATACCPVRFERRAMATSVFVATSPQSRRSMGSARSMSRLMSRDGFFFVDLVGGSSKFERHRESRLENAGVRGEKKMHNPPSLALA